MISAQNSLFEVLNNVIFCFGLMIIMVVVVVVVVAMAVVMAAATIIMSNKISL
jgi:hypothetical protein